MRGVGFVPGSKLRFSRYPLIKHDADATDVVDQIRMRDTSENGKIALIRQQEVIEFLIDASTNTFIQPAAGQRQIDVRSGLEVSFGARAVEDGAFDSDDVTAPRELAPPWTQGVRASCSATLLLFQIHHASLQRDQGGMELA